MKSTIIAIALLLVACVQSPTGDVIQNTPISIGEITSLTGKGAVYGEEVHQGIMLAVEHINTAGGINGRPLSVISEDEQCNAQVGTTAAIKLTSVDTVVAVVGPMCSTVAVAAAPVFQEASVVAISPVASAASLTSKGDYIFRVSVSTKNHGVNIARFVVDELAIENVAILYINQDNGVEYRDGFIKAFEERGGVVTHVESYEPTTTDYKTVLAKLAEDADLLFVAGQLNLELILRQSHELGLSWTIVGVPAMESVDIEATGASAEGVFYSYSSFTPDDSALVTYQDAFEKKYGVPSGWFAANAYDATMLIADGLRMCGEDSACIRDYLFTVEGYPGVGGVTTFDEQGDVDKPLVIKTIRNSTFEMYWTYGELVR